ncbi:hypothetical protein B1207_06250 [Legionella quinlivanii]|uniref:EPTP domain protein n=1 Tax=Legionella quinlivanii TaxID=45073 RepID=A0A364LKA6_9GAMM|nr:hypothetical protein [Legionella quinlivanii]RAP37024.1 hypothetical protein B1207_06250 [Legionella quinlivanii]
MKGFLRPLTGMLLFLLCINAHSTMLKMYQSLDTSGARELTPFKLNGKQYIGVAQLAKDNPHAPANMNGGDSDVDVLIYQMGKKQFHLYQKIPGHGNEGLTFFKINDQAFIAVPSVRSGPGAPYNLNTYSMIYRWDGKYFIPFQQFYGRAAKQWRFFSIANRNFLALATGVEVPGQKPVPNDSRIYEWNGKEFVLFQSLPSRWAYSFTAFKIGDDTYLGLADHLDGVTIFNWNGKQFKPIQHISERGARALKHFKIENEHYLAYANIHKTSKLLHWNTKQFEEYQNLAESGGRSFSWFSLNGRHFLFLTRFITGSKEKPVSNLDSLLYEWEKGKLHLVEKLPGFGAVAAHFFKWNNESFLTLANSLSKNIRFRVDSVIYKLDSDTQ